MSAWRLPQLTRRGAVSSLLGLAVVALLLAGSACAGQSENGGAVPAPSNGSNAQVLSDRPAAPTGAGSAPEDWDPVAAVAALEQALIRIYQDVLPSMVHVRASRRFESGQRIPDIPGHPDVFGDEFLRDFFHQGEGSGFVWDQEGRIVTNDHLVRGADRVTVVFADGEELRAKLLGTDPDSDLAVLELEDDKDGLRPVVLGDSDALQVGQMAVAIGDPFGQQFSMTTGIVSAVGRTISGADSRFSIPEVIQTDTSINPGNSGGPLLDRHGRVIGVNTQIMTHSGVSSGVGFAVPINIAKKVVPALIEDGEYDYSWLGISAATLSPEAAERMDLPRNSGGALILGVSPDSPADEAGLQGSDDTFTLEGIEFPLGGDVIVGINGSAVRLMDDLVAFLVRETRPDDVVSLEVIREGGERVMLEVTLGQRPS